MNPYKKIKSQNLEFLLLTSKVTAFLGMFGVVASLFYSIFLAYAIGIAVGIAGVSMVFFALALLFCSGIMAAIVAFEESYRLRTEALIGAGSE
jgi:hypothetical protein